MEEGCKEEERVKVLEQMVRVWLKDNNNNNDWYKYYCFIFCFEL